MRGREPAGSIARMAADAVTRFDTPEHRRLEDARTGRVPWKAWGPYLSERQWGTVREDYSDDGDAWRYFSHDQARSRAYRWGEDGIAGISDERQRLCLSLALWNGADPILKERMFGLTNGEGNHGEDVKEYWFYLDSTPTHSYLKCLYKYPQRAYPYEDLIATNGRRSKTESEYELLDTGVFAEDRYFDVVVEYAKGAHDDVLMLVTAHNRGPDEATLHLLPTLWFRNTWSWGDDVAGRTWRRVTGPVHASHPDIGDWTLRADAPPTSCSARTRRTTSACSARPTRRRTSRTRSTTRSSRAPRARSIRRVPGRRSPPITSCRSRPGRARRSACASPPRAATPPRRRAARGRLRRVFAARRDEADAFYATVIPAALDADAANVMRQALAGLLWGKQYYEYDVHRWLREHGVNPWDAAAPRAGAQRRRGSTWSPATSSRCPTSGSTRGSRRGTSPSTARRWRSSTSTSPRSRSSCCFLTATCTPTARSRRTSGTSPTSTRRCTAWAALCVYEREAEIRGEGDHEFLTRVFERLLTNFTLVGQPQGPRRPQPLPGRVPRPRQHRHLRPLRAAARRRHARAGRRHRLDGPVLPVDAADRARARPRRPVYADIALKFIVHFEWIAIASNPPGGDALWDEEDGFYYDVMRMPDGTTVPLQVRSLVGLLPLCAATVFDAEMLAATR